MKDIPRYFIHKTYETYEYVKFIIAPPFLYGLKPLMDIKHDYFMSYIRICDYIYAID